MKTWIYLIGVMLLPIVYVALMLTTDQAIEWPAIAMMALITVPICIALVVKNSARQKAGVPLPHTGRPAPSHSNRSMSSRTVSSFGWTLVVTGAIAGATAIANYQDPNAAIAGAVVVVWVALGTALAEMGARMGVEKFPQVTRSFSPGTIGLGLAIVAISCGILYLFSHVHIIPRIVLFAALLGVPGGILLAAMCFADTCAQCSKALRLARLRFTSMPNGIWAKLRLGHVREVLDELGSPQPRGEHRLDFWYCKACRQIVLCKPRDEKLFVLQSNSARLLTDLV